eukprot:Phypoly_transcript_02630.p1 GENE.Phypoly_transcript_02630~~Phypoly_transcript_02630.p1  ORF type:complete len:771 (+),score=189.59 Phypoly_transcript_02630:61-2313(+)
MAGVQLDELEKAQRSMRVSIFNSTLRVLTRQKIVLHQGMFRVQPPETIDSLSTVEFGSESSGMMTGTEAGAIYVVQGVQGFFEFGWNNPYFGKRGYKKTAPAGFEVECNAIDGTNCVVSFVVTETAPQRTEAEIQQEKLKVDTALAEMERVVKGIEKMLTVYASKKDTKNMKLVEDEIAAKQRDMDQARARLHSLNLELEKKVKEDDPLYIQQELQKIKGKIEAAAKVKKGIELMKDMYSSGSQKDPRQALVVDQQLESKKREMDALHKFEQKLLDQLNRVNAGGATQPVSEAHHGTAQAPASSDASAAPPADTPASSNEPVRARILFEVVPNSDTELALQAGDIVDVLDKSGAEWWEGEFAGKRGYFPAAYAELIQEISTEASKAEYTYPKATVITDYTPNAEGELALKIGDTITVYGWDDAYWWEGSKGGTVGFFPCHCVQWIDTSADSAGAVNTSGDYYEDIGKKDDQAQPQAEPATSHATHHDAQHTHAETPQEAASPQQHLPAEPATSEAAPLLSNQEPPQPEPTAEPTYVLPPPPTEPVETLPPPPIETPAIIEPPPHQEPAPVSTAPRKLSQPPPPAHHVHHEPPQVIHHEPQVVQHEPLPALQAQPPQAQQTPQPQHPQPASAAKTSPTPGPASKTPVAVPQGVTTAMRRAPSGQMLTGKPRALPQPNAHRVTASSDTNMTAFKEGLKQRASEFANIIEQYTSAAVSQHLDTITKLQDRVKELETLNAQVTKERDELKISTY